MVWGDRKVVERPLRGVPVKDDLVSREVDVCREAYGLGRSGRALHGLQ